MKQKDYPKRRKTRHSNNIKAQNIADSFSFPDKTDPLGSWTGTPFDENEPVQDADDL